MRVSELRGALEDALGPTYRVEREVRPVGECRLFVAVGPPTDPELLVKVLPAELSLAVDAAVFEREVLLLGDRLGHAQLVPPRGSGRAGAFVYHARRFVEGTTLRAWLANHGEMPLRRVIEVLRDVLLALAHAHRGSIAHGDLRPENVLLTAGRVQVADTGIVDAVGRAVPSALAGGVGATLCAPAYLAPERRKNGGAGGPRVARSVFARQMTALAQAGWQTLTLAQFVERRQLGTSAFRTPHSAFLLTFDDGYAGLAQHAYPVLADLGFTATTFLITDYVGANNTWDMRYTWRPLAHLDWRTVEQWRARGFDFASHTASHARLTWLGDARAADELGRARATLVRRLGASAGRAVAYPFGAADARVERLARSAGHELGFGGVRGNGGAMHVPRIPVYVWDAGNVPLGLRADRLGSLGRLVAHVANRCAVGTAVLKRLG